jgi:hypothetical protein
MVWRNKAAMAEVDAEVLQKKLDSCQEWVDSLTRLLDPQLGSQTLTALEVSGVGGYTGDRST